MGESFLLGKKFQDMLSYVKSKDLKIALNTNGTFLNDGNINFLIKSGVERIIVGIDAFKKETYETIRINGNFEKVKKNTINFIEEVKKSSSNTQIVVQFIEMDENKNEENLFIDYWTKMGAKVKIRQKGSWIDCINTNTLNENKNRKPCPWLLHTGTILWNGDVTICCIDYDGKYRIGNVKENNFRKIWLGDLKKLRDIHIKGDFSNLPKICKGCKDWQVSNIKII